MDGNGHFELVGSEQDLYRIGAVSRLTATKPFVLRYWETEFPMLQPEKSPKGHRLYRRQDIETVLVIKRLLYDEGFTIAGARKHLREQGTDSAGNGQDGRQDAAAPSESEMLSKENRPFHTDHVQQVTGNSSQLEQRSLQYATRASKTPMATLDRQILVELRDSLRSFLTLLESE